MDNDDVVKSTGHVSDQSKSMQILCCTTICVEYISFRRKA